MDVVQLVALGAGMAWASGLRLYAVLLAAGLLGRFGYLDLPAGLEVVQHPLVIGAAGLMFVLEFFADKIPALDSMWDAVHTFVRIPAGAILAALALGEYDPAVMLAAGLIGGSLAAATHAAKAGSRALINTSPEPFSNVVASVGEDALVAGGLYAAFSHPYLFLALLGLFVLLLVWLLPKLWRGVKSVLARITGKGPGVKSGPSQPEGSF